MDAKREPPPPYQYYAPPYNPNAPPPPGFHHQPAPQNPVIIQPIAVPVHEVSGTPGYPVVTHTQVTIQHTHPNPSCPVCHNNSWETFFPMCAVCIAIFCFPIGILFCCCMQRKRCSKCGFIPHVR